MTGIETRHILPLMEVTVATAEKGGNMIDLVRPQLKT